MQRSYDELDQLADLLEAEARGQAIDRDHGRRLAERLSLLCPEIARTMGRIAERMAANP